MQRETQQSDTDFLAFCQLVQDVFIAVPDAESQNDSVGTTSDLLVPQSLRERAHDFANARRGLALVETSTFGRKMSAREFRGRLFVCTELAEWMYDQLRILHSNVVLQKRTIGFDGPTEEFVLPYYMKNPYTIPRLAPSLAYRPRANERLRFAEWFPIEAHQIPLPTLDEHFAHAYLYVLTGLGESPDPDWHEDAHLAAQAYANHWNDNGRKQLLRLIIGTAALANGRNVFSTQPLANPAVTSKAVDSAASKRRKLYFDLTLGIDRWIDQLGRWWNGTTWTFQESYVRSSKYRSAIENRLDITFLEEAEILWELLRFYACALQSEATHQNWPERLLELFWIAKKEGVRWKTSERFQNLVAWRASSSAPDQWTSPESLVRALEKEIVSKNPNDILRACRSIVPVYALLMILPPPEGVYRCELGFRALDDSDEKAFIKSAWCFTTINLPEAITHRAEFQLQLARLVAKQKMLVGMMIDATLKEEFKEAYRNTINHHGKKLAVAAIMARNMSHNIGSHVLAHLATDTLSCDASEVAGLMAYLRTRMDFIADIATGSAAGSVGLALRRDILSQFSEQTLLCRYISGVEGVHVGKIELEYRSEKQKKVRDIELLIPNGVLGAQALFVILENIVRNTAKHTKGLNASSPLVLKILVGECDYPGYCEVSVFDALSSGDEKTIEELNRKLQLPITDSTGKTNSRAWGLKEIRICAAYLRDLPPHLSEGDQGLSAINSSDSPPTLIKAVLGPGSSIGYRFYLMKPKHVLITHIPDDLMPSVAVRAVLHDHGIECFAGSAPDISAHDFLVSYSNVDSSEKPHGTPSVPEGIHSLRCFHIGTSGHLIVQPSVITELFAPADIPRAASAFLARLWTLWIDYVVGPDVCLVIQATQSQNILPWRDCGGRVMLRTPNDYSPLPPGAVVLDRHGELLVAYRNDRRNHSRMFERVLAYDAVTSNSPMRSLLENPPDNERARERLACQLIDASACGVILIDERFQNACTRSLESLSEGQTISTYEALRCSQVFIPPKPDDREGGVDLDQPALEPLLQWVDKTISDDRTRVRFIVVHLGILERLFKTEAGAFSEQTASEQLNRWKEKGVAVVVTSGRGSPEVLKTLGVRFVHYSQLSRHVMEQRSKLHLVNVLYSARILPT